MIEPIEWLRIFIDNHKSFEYIIIFFGAALGGEFALFTLGFLAAQNVVATLPLVVLGFLGAFFPNIFWFLFGRTATAERIISHRYANTAISTVTEAVRRASKGNHLTALIITKFLIGTPLILIMYVSKTKLEFKKFIYYEAVAIFLSLLVIVPIGFTSGLGFAYLSEVFQNLYAIAGFILLTIILVIMVQLWIEKRFTQNLSSADEKNNL